MAQPDRRAQMPQGDVWAFELQGRHAEHTLSYRDLGARARSRSAWRATARARTADLAGFASASRSASRACSSKLALTANSRHDPAAGRQGEFCALWLYQVVASLLRIETVSTR